MDSSTGLALLKSGDYSDLTIKCGDREWKVHKNFLCSQSQVLKREMNSHWKESQTGIIEHTTFDPDIVDYFLHFIYTRNYEVRSSTAENIDTPTATSPHDETSAGNTACDEWKSLEQQFWPWASFYRPMAQDESRSQNQAAVHVRQNLYRDTNRAHKLAHKIMEKLVAHIKVWAIADYYMVSDLMTLASLNFTRLLVGGGEYYMMVIEALRAHTPSGGELQRLYADYLVQTFNGDSGQYFKFMQQMNKVKDMQGFLAMMLSELATSEQVKHDRLVAELHVANEERSLLKTKVDELSADNTALKHELARESMRLITALEHVGRLKEEQQNRNRVMMSYNGPRGNKRPRTYYTRDQWTSPHGAW